MFFAIVCRHCGQFLFSAPLIGVPEEVQMRAHIGKLHPDAGNPQSGDDFVTHFDLTATTDPSSW